MPGSKLFSGPPSNKATASTLAAAVTTLFWTIAAHTFWKSMSTEDLTLYITTSTVILTAVIGFLVPESAAYTAHNSARLATRATTLGSTTTTVTTIPAAATAATTTPATTTPAATIPAAPTSATSTPAATIPATTTPAIDSAIATLEARVQGIQELQTMMAARLGVTQVPAIHTPTQ